MSYNTNAKVNPFYIQDDEEDPWDDDYGDEDEYEDYDDEQVMLMSGSGGVKNRKYNDSNRQQQQQQNSYSNNSHFSRSYHNGRYENHDRHLEHRPQFWKYGFLLATIIGVFFVHTDRSNNVSLSSLIDEIPNDEIHNDGYRIVVLGERHSGTVWMRERLRECFPRVEVSNHLQRMGYFFQDDEETARSKAEFSEALNSIHNTNATTIVVHVTLNVYDWLEQMRLSPEYAPDHAGKHQQLGHPVPLGWKEFLSKPWTIERPDSDLELANATGPVCQMGFGYNEVVSCSKSAEGIGDPMYELYENGDPFGSIIDLRTAKLQNHQGVFDKWPSVEKIIQISYETIPRDFKNKLLHEILEFTGWEDDLPCSANALPPSLERSKDMTVEFVDFVSDRADWETEQRVGSYTPWTIEEIAAKKIHSETSTPESVDQDNSSKPAAIDNAKKENEKTPNSDESLPTNEEPEKQKDTSAEDETNENEAMNQENLESSSSSSSQNAEDIKKSTDSDAADNDSQSISAEKEDDSSAGVSSSSKEKSIEETNIEESPTPPKEESNNEEKTEPSKAAEEETPENVTPKETNKISKDSTKNTSEEKEEEKLPSTKEDEEGGAGVITIGTVSASSEKTGDSKESPSDGNIKSNDESPIAEESTSGEETNVEKDEASGNENKEKKEMNDDKSANDKKEKDNDDNGKSADENKSESQTEETIKLEEDHAADETKSESNEDGGRQ